MRRRLGERGALAPAVPVLAMAMLLLAGMIIDGSRQLNARGEAVAFAEEAARAGAQAVDLNQDNLVLDQPAAQSRVDTYCATVLAQRQVESCQFMGIQPVSATDPRPLVVQVRVTMRIKSSLLGIIGVTTLSASGEAKARPFEGVDAGDAG